MIQQEEKEKDYGTVVGVKGDAVALRNNIENVANDENVFDPVVYVDPEIVEYDGKTLIGIRVPARFVIERDRMYVENACRASSGDALTPDNFMPDPRNPIIANFFRVIGYADQLGSGVRNLYKYAKAYGGADPQLKDGDVFRIEVSLKSLEVAPIGAEVAPINGEVAQRSAEVAQTGSEVAQRGAEVAQRLSGKGRADAISNATLVFEVIFANNKSSISEIENKTGLSNGSVKNAIRLLRINGIIKREGADFGGKWAVLI